MLKDLAQRLGAGAAAVILAAFAGGIAFVALAYALFAFMERYVSPAGAAAITAVVFLVVTGALAVLVPKNAPKKEDLEPLRPTLDPRTLRMATEGGAVVLGILGDMALSHRLSREDKAIKTRSRLTRVLASDDRVDRRAESQRREAKAAEAKRREDKALRDKLNKAKRHEDKAVKAKRRADKALRSERLKRFTSK